jgi:hypothetical protein
MFILDSAIADHQYCLCGEFQRSEQSGVFFVIVERNLVEQSVTNVQRRLNLFPADD